jgi:hypothetical protein
MRMRLEKLLQYICKEVDPNSHTNDSMQKTNQEMPGKQNGIAEELSEQEGRLSL